MRGGWRGKNLLGRAVFFNSDFSACGAYVTILPKLTGGGGEIFCEARIS
jgi:hypothetical protein